MKLQLSTLPLSRIIQLSTISLASSLTLVACNFSISTATLDNVQVCSEVQSNGQCDSDSAPFAKDAAELVATADLKYAPEGTLVTIDWNYLGGEAGQATAIDSVSLETEENMDLVTSSLTTPQSGWPSGDYEVVFSLDTDNSQPISKQFSVVE